MLKCKSLANNFKNKGQGQTSKYSLDFILDFINEASGTIWQKLRIYFKTLSQDLLAPLFNPTPPSTVYKDDNAPGTIVYVSIKPY